MDRRRTARIDQLMCDRLATGQIGDAIDLLVESKSSGAGSQLEAPRLAERILRGDRRLVDVDALDHQVLLDGAGCGRLVGCWVRVDVRCVLQSAEPVQPTPQV